MKVLLVIVVELLVIVLLPFGVGKIGGRLFPSLGCDSDNWFEKWLVGVFFLVVISLIGVCGSLILFINIAK